MRQSENMLASSALLILRLAVQSDPQILLDGLRSAIESQSKPRIEGYFARKEDAGYLFEMAESRGGLRTVGVKMVPVPPGWMKEGGYWVVFHTVQDIEDHHDPVHVVIKTGEGLRLGREIPEWAPQSVTIEHAQIDARITPADKSLEVQTFLKLKPGKEKKAPVFRLQDSFQVSEARLDSAITKVVTAGKDVPQVSPGDVVRAGSLLIPYTRDTIGSAEFRYKGVVSRDGEDHIDAKVAYLTAWWVPSIGRLPHTTETRITYPRGWVARSEGVRTTNDVMSSRLPREQTEAAQTYTCEIPISYPKIVAGAFLVAAELEEDGKVYRSYQFDPVDKVRGEKDVKAMAEAVRFYEHHLLPFPFPGYECFDGDGYYGIESYSYTILAKNITTWAVDHEIGHTYFGGMAPCPYVRDSWNEGVTTYMDDVVSGKMADHPLENAMRGVGLTTPLDRMPAPEEHDSHTYWRGAYVMKMLEEEIGRNNVIRGLRDVLRGQVGKDTGWPELLPYFEKASGKNLQWFWKQWVSNGVFPTVSILKTRKLGAGQTEVTLDQSGTAAPFQLRYAVVARRGGQTKRQIVTTRDPQAVVTIQAEFEPDEVSIDPLGYALIKVGPPAKVGA